MLKFSIAIVFTFMALSVECAERVWNINSFGAVNDAMTNNAPAIQRAIDECHANGGGRVEIEAGVYLSGTIMLKSDVVLCVKRDAILRGSPNPMDYQCIDPFTDATGQKRGESFICAIDARNVGICGDGIIEGQGERFLPEQMRKTLAEKNISDFNSLVKVRPFLVRFVRTSGIIVENIRMRQPAAWTCHFYQCRDIKVSGVSIYSHAHKNNDGLDFDSCDGATVENCDIDTGDDAICFKTTSAVPCRNISVTGCRLRSNWGALKFGTESMGDFCNITIRDCKIWDTRGGGIKILSVDGANISNVELTDIEMVGVDMPIFIRLGERRLTYRNAPRQPVGSIDKVRISNITATTRSNEDSRVNPASGIFITGTPDHSIGRIELDKIHIIVDGGGNESHAALQPSEDVERYPEYIYFGILPAYGITSRHVRQLTMSNVTFVLKQNDLRHEVMLSDVDELFIK